MNFAKLGNWFCPASSSNTFGANESNPRISVFIGEFIILYLLRPGAHCGASGRKTAGYFGKTPAAHLKKQPGGRPMPGRTLHQYSDRYTFKSPFTYWKTCTLRPSSGRTTLCLHVLRENQSAVSWSMLRL